MTRRRKALIVTAFVAADLIVGLLVTGDDSRQEQDRAHTANVEYFTEHCFNQAGNRIC